MAEIEKEILKIDGRVIQILISEMATKLTSNEMKEVIASVKLTQEATESVITIMESVQNLCKARDVEVKKIKGGKK